MAANALNSVWSDDYILKIIIQQELQKLKNEFLKRLDFNDIKFPAKISDSHKFEKKKNSTAIRAFSYENKLNIQYMYHKNVKKNLFIYH